MVTTRKLKAIMTATGVAVAAFATFLSVRASDHADTPDNAANPGQDISDVYVFPSPTNANNVVLVMNVSPLITPSQVATRRFDPSILYQFKIDNTGDKVEDLVIQARFDGSAANQTCHISGPMKPTLTGVSSAQLPADAIAGTFNVPFTLSNGAAVFCGTREDPFFFDLEQFFTILPDRATPVNGVAVTDPNTPKATTWRAPGKAVDFLSNGKYSVLSIVVELPKAMLTGTNGSKIAVWCTTSK